MDGPLLGRGDTGEALGRGHRRRECQKNVEFCILLAFDKTLCNELNIASNEQKIANERTEKWTDSAQISVSDRKIILPNRKELSKRTATDIYPSGLLQISLS